MNAIVPYYDPSLTPCTVHLHGQLKQFGDSVTIPGSTVSVALRNMLIKKPAMRYVLEQGCYRVVRGAPEGGIDLDASMLHMQIGPSRQIHLFPVAQGGGGNGNGSTLKTVLGAVIIVAAVALAIAEPELIPAEMSAFSYFSAVGTIALIGASMLLAGISALISPQPGLGSSYLISGNLNTAQQGTPVPLVYGIARVGSVVVGTAYAAEDYTTSTSNYEGAGAYNNSKGGFSGFLDAFDTGNPLPPGASGKGGSKSSSSSGGIQAPNTLESKSIVTIVDVISEGPIAGLVGGPQGIFFNNTPLMNADGSYNFRGVTWYYLYGTPDQPAVPGFPAASEDVVVNTQCFYGNPTIQQLQSTTATQTRVTVELPALFATNTQNGDVNPSTLILMIEVAEVVGTAAGAYSQVVYDTINGKCTSPYQKSYVFNLPGAGVGTSPITAWNIRVTKLTPESAVATTINTLYWYSYDLITNNLIGYEDTAAVLLQIDSEAFGSSLPSRTYLVEGIGVQVPLNYNAAAGTYNSTGPGTSGGAWDYASFQTETTSNPAWILYDFLSNARYGLGLSPQNLETVAIQLYEIAQYCDGLVPDGNGATERRYALNGVFNQRANAFQVMQAIAATFRGQVYWAGGQVCVTCDQPKAPIKIYTNANVINGNFAYQGTSLKTRHTMVNSHFNDPSNQYLPGIEPVELPQQIATRGIVTADILGFGVTSRGLAHRLGNWLLYTENFQTETVTFSVSWDSAGVMPGDLIQIADPAIAGIRMGGRLRSLSTTSALALDMPFTPVAGQTYAASVILQDGNLAESVAIASFSNATDAVTGAAYTIANLAAALYTAPLPGAVFILQDATVTPTEWSVSGITETGRGIFEIVAAQYNPGKFTLVEDVPTLNISSFSNVPSTLAAPLGVPTNVTAITTLSGQGVTTIVQTTISWTAPIPLDPRVVQYQVSIVNAEGTTVAVLTPSGTSVEIDNLSPDTYYFAVRALGSNGSTSSWAYSAPFLISGTSANAPPAVTNLVAVAGFRQVQLTWTASAQHDVLYYLIWRSSTAPAPEQPGSLAAMIGTTSGTTFADVDSQTLMSGTTWNYWVQPMTSTAVLGALSVAVTVVIAYISPADFSTNILPGFVTAIQAVGIWQGAALPTTQGEADGAISLYWSVTGQLYSWSNTAEAYVAATPTPETLAPGTLNPDIIIPGTALTGTIIAAQVAGDLANASISATGITGAVTPAQLSFTDPTNLCLNPIFTINSLPDASGWSTGMAAEANTATGVPANAPTVNVGAQTAETVTYGTPFAVLAGQVWYFAAWVAGSAANVASLELLLTDAKAGNPTAVVAAHATPAGSWVLISGQVTVPATITTGVAPAYGQIALDLGTSGTYPAVYWTNITCRQGVSTNLVAPGSITAVQIAAATITAAQIAGVAASQITGALTASQVASVNAASIAGTIAASQIAAIPASQISGTIAAAQIAGVAAAQVTGTLTASQIAAVNAASIAGTITGSQITANTITAGNIATGTITSTQIAAGTITAANIAAGTIQAANIAAGAITTASLAVGSNANVIWNSCGGQTTAGWTLQDGAVGPLFSATGPFILPGYGSFALWIPSLAAGGYASTSWVPLASNTNYYGASIPVVPGQTYEAQAQIITDNGLTATLYIIWASASGASIGGNPQTTSSVPTQNASGAVLSNWTQYWVNGVAPATAAYATILIRAQNNTAATVTAANMHITQTSFGLGVPNATGPSAWAPGGVTTISGGQIITNSITANQILAGTITTTQLAAATITASNIAAATITSTQIAAGTITAANIAAGTIQASNIAAGTITGNNILANTITTTQIAAGTITSSDIAANTITGSNIAAGTLTAANIAAGTITATQIQAGTITGAQIAATTITAKNVAAYTLTSANIAANTITANNVAFSTINTYNIAAATIQVANIAAGVLSASNITAGVLNAGVVIASIASLGTVQITNANIAYLTVGTSNITDGAITSTYAASGAADNVGVGVNCTGGPVLIVVKMSYQMTGTIAQTVNVTGGAFTQAAVTVPAGGGYEVLSLTFSTIDTTGQSGYVAYYANITGAQPISMQSMTITCVVVKK